MHCDGKTQITMLHQGLLRNLEESDASREGPDETQFRCPRILNRLNVWELCQLRCYGLQIDLIAFHICLHNLLSVTPLYFFSPNEMDHSYHELFIPLPKHSLASLSGDPVIKTTKNCFLEIHQALTLFIFSNNFSPWFSFAVVKNCTGQLLTSISKTMVNVFKVLFPHIFQQTHTDMNNWVGRQSPSAHFTTVISDRPAQLCVIRPWTSACGSLETYLTQITTIMQTNS